MLVVLIGAVVFGMALRVAAALGPLGLDEAWSLRLAADLPTIGDAFWGLPHDNNHPLTTAAMVAFGPDRPTWIYRIPALVFGALTILAVAQALAPKGRVAAATGAMLAAVTLPFVDFGSEARGYAGLVLASVLAIAQWRRAIDGAAGVSNRRSGRWGLAAAAGFGAFNHLAMVVTVAVLVAATLVEGGLRTRRIGLTLVATARLFAPTALAMLPAALALAVAVRRGGGFRVGDVDPFTPAKLATGLGDMIAFTLGVPTTPVAPLIAAMLLACLIAGARRGLLDRTTQSLCVAAFLALPAALWAAGMPNVGYARYFAICAVVLVLALSEIASRLRLQGGTAARWAVAGLAVVLVASLLEDLPAIRVGRSPGPGTLAILEANRQTSYATSHPVMTALLLGAARPLVVASRLEGTACDGMPEWYIAVGTFDARPDGTVTFGRDDCRQTYSTPVPFGSNPLSGTQWTLYRRVPQGPSRAITVSPGSGDWKALSSTPDARRAASKASTG